MSFNRSEYANYSSVHDYPQSGALKELAAPGYYTGKPPLLEEVQQMRPLPDIEYDIEDTQLLASSRRQAPYRRYVLPRDMLAPDPTLMIDINDKERTDKSLADLVARLNEEDREKEQQQTIEKVIIPSPILREMGADAIKLLEAASSL